MEVSGKVSFPLDEDDFLSQECPQCSRRFKVKANSDSIPAVEYCPYCGHHGENCWWTQEQIDHITGKATGPVLAAIKETLESANQPNSLIKFSVDVSMDNPQPEAPDEDETPMEMTTLPCCLEPIKHIGPVSYCVMCGKPAG